MNMKIGNNLLSVFVLMAGQLLKHIRLMMIIHQCNGSDRFLVSTPFFTHKLVSDEISNRFGAILIPLSVDKLIKGGKKFFFQRNPKADQLAHRHPPSGFVLSVPNPTFSYMERQMAGTEY